MPRLADGFAAIDAAAEAAVGDLARMVAVDTSFPPGCGYDAFADLMETLVAPLDLRCERVMVPEQLWRVQGGPRFGARVNLIARRKSGKTGKPVLGPLFPCRHRAAGAGWTRPIRSR